MLGDGLTAGSAVSAKDIQDTIGDADFLGQSGNDERRQGRFLGGFEDESVAGGEGRPDLVDQHEERDVPGNDTTADTEGLTEGDVDEILGVERGVTLDVESSAGEVS